MQTQSTLSAGFILACCATPTYAQFGGGMQPAPFSRVATFPTFLNTSINESSSAETVAVSVDGGLVIYTDSGNGLLGFVDITDPAQPVAAGTLALGGEPTSVAVSGGFALTCVDTSVSFVNPSGDFVVVDLATRAILRTIALGGQPDSIAISPDGAYAAIAIENQRDEELGNGAPPQLPAGYLAIIDLVGDPSQWALRTVNLTGIADLFPEDPEPEFVDINAANVAVVTLQENNHIVLVDLATGAVLLDFPAGTVDLTDVDTNENDLIQQDSSLTAVPREPDAVQWVSPFTFATADEGDLDGGSRGFTVFAPWGLPLFEAGNSVEHTVARLGHYPESRSENKGCEPEGLEYGVFGGSRYLFVASERANVVLVYLLTGGGLFGANEPMLVQVLPTGVAPEGLIAIPERDLLVVACEADDRSSAYRGSIMIYSRDGQGDYPHIVSADRSGASVPIPWAAQSGLVVAPGNDSVLYSVHDSYYRNSRVFELNAAPSGRLRIVSELPIADGNEVVEAALVRTKLFLPSTPDFEVGAIVEQDRKLNLDLEGIAVESNGTTFWLASEGAGNLVDGVSNASNQPFSSPNLILRAVRFPGVDHLEVTSVLGLPFEMARNQNRFGLEGIAVADDQAIFVCLQREWTNAGDPVGKARIGRFEFATRKWTFAHYPLDAATSPNGGWVGMSDLTYLGNGRLAILERDNQGGLDARVKRIYTVDTTGVAFRDVSQLASFETLTKTLEVDFIATAAYDAFGGPVPEKLEGMAVLSDGTTLIVNDNDGIDDNSGETLVLRLPQLLR